jgi:multidrug efflux pump subunit AcrA (membrane-fusion protein)
VDWISGALDPVTHTAKLRCVIPNPKRELRPEMLASLAISVGSEKALAVRRSAVLRLGDDTVVFVEQAPAANGQIRFERRVVAVREDLEGDLVPVTKGLTPNEKVVTTGAIMLAGMI